MFRGVSRRKLFLVVSVKYWSFHNKFILLHANIQKWLAIATKVVGDDLPRGGTFLGARRIRSLHSVPENGVSGTEYPLRTGEACFLHRMSLKMRRVPQEAFLSTARIFGTREGPLRYRMPTTQPSSHPTTQPPSHHSTSSTPVPNATKPEMGKALPAANLSNSQKRGGHYKSAARNASQVIPYGKPWPYFIANT